MNQEQRKAELRRRYQKEADAVFEAAWARGEAESLDLDEIEGIVNELKFKLTSLLVESMVEVQEERQAGPGPKCPKCGREMYSKGKRRRRVSTSQGEIEIARRYHYCEACQQGFFPPGPAAKDEVTGVE
jgi:tRNA(Ile2) C34 agmatinyltransferase TiaS